MTELRLEELSLAHEAAFFSSELFAEGVRSGILTKSISNSAEFKKIMKESAKDRLDWRPGGGKTSITRYVLIDHDGAIRALGLMRFPLDEVTEIDGGNLICEVAPSIRGRGYGSYCLALLLFEAVRAGLRRVLVTAPVADGAARRIIEKNRGRLEAVASSPLPGRGEIARYWISFGDS